MFRAMISPIFRSNRLCYSLWYNVTTMLPTGRWPTTSWVHYTTSCNTQSSVPEDRQNNYPKHVELTGIINKPLLLYLVGCLYYLYQWCTVKQILDKEIYMLSKYIKIALWRVARRLSYIEDARCLKLKHWLKIRDKCIAQKQTSFLAPWFVSGNTDFFIVRIVNL